MYFAAALEADGGRVFARQCYHCPSTARSCGAGIFFLQYSCAKVNISRATPRLRYWDGHDLGYLGHIFVVAERFFQLNADEAGEQSSVAVRNDDNPRLFVRSEARMLSSVVLPLPLNSALRRSSFLHRRLMPILSSYYLPEFCARIIAYFF